MKALGMTFGDESKTTYFRFFSENRQYNITRFQRSYTWGRYQIEGILKDIEYIRKTGESVAWPSILIQKSPSRFGDNPNISYYDIGDGQQRIISVNLGLLALSRVASIRRYEEDSEDLEYLFNFIPDKSDRNRKETLLGRVFVDDLKQRSLKPIINFFSESSNKAFKDIFTLDDEELKAKIEDSTENNKNSSRIFEAFSIYYEEFNNSKYTNSDLREIADIILKQIYLTVIEYETSENMQRAFANMNSFGVQLTEPELVKAEFYGYFKSEDPELAEEMAQYWTHELESPSWEGEIVKNGAFATFTKTSPLETFLGEYYHSMTNWSIILEKPLIIDGKKATAALQREHWLRDGWANELQKLSKTKGALRKLWEDFKKSAEIIRIARSNTNYSKDTTEWWVNYTYNMLSSFRNYISIMIRSYLTMSNEDFIKSLKLLTRYWLYLTFVTDNGRNVNAALIYLSSPLLKERNWDYELVKYTLETAKAPKNQWRDQWYIKNKLMKNEYDDSFNNKILELFIFVCNIKHLEEGQIDSLYNTRTEVKGFSRSREHIIPQTPRRVMSEDDRIKYDSYVKRLGNSVILSTKDNSTANNKNPENKIEIYLNEGFHPWGMMWKQKVLDLYSETQKWGYEEVDKMSKVFADIIAPMLSPEIPYSDFRSLLKSENIGDTFWFENHGDSDIELTLLSNGLFSTESGKTFGSFQDIKEFFPEILENKRTIKLAKFDDEKKSVIKEITLRNGKILSTEDIKETEDKNMVVSISGKEYSNGTLKSIYVQVISDNIESLKEIERSFELFKIKDMNDVPENKLHLYSQVSENLLAYSVYSRDIMALNLILLAKNLDSNIAYSKNLKKYFDKVDETE